MEQVATDLRFEVPENVADDNVINPPEVRLITSSDQTLSLFYRNQLLAQYQKNDNYTRNMVIVQLFLCHRVSQKTLSEVFQLTIQHISTLVSKYRQTGSAGIQDRTVVRIGNNQKIKGKVADEIVKQLRVAKENRPTYISVVNHIERKYGVQLSPHRISGWWRKEQENHVQQSTPNEPEQMTLEVEDQRRCQRTEEHRHHAEGVSSEDRDNTEDKLNVEEQWQPNNIAGSFILYAMLNESQFLNPFTANLKQAVTSSRKTVERVMLTLFFIHALRLKSIEQTKHLLAAHFGPLVLGAFCRLQSLRYAIDDISEQPHFDKAITQHYQNICERTELGDDIYYTDGHFSCYYGKYAIPKGYDARRKQAARGRNTLYLHNSLGHNILSFESPTNTTLSVDIETLIGEMKTAFGEVKGKNLFFDRGGFSAACFKKITKAEMYFTTYLKYRKKQAEIDECLFEEVEINIHGTVVKNRLYETEIVRKAYGKLRTIIFIGKQGKQIPVITTNLTLSAVEIVARLQKRWVEENGFKYMDEHFNIDLLTTYETEEAPDKIMSRANPDRKAANKAIAEKKAALNALKEDYATKLEDVKDKDELTIATFEEKEQVLRWQIKNIELELGLLELNRKAIPSKVETNMKDESVISCQKRRLFINLVKTMNYNCEKWLQLLFCQYHPKADETLSLIRHVLIQPGRIRQRGQVLEVELERLDSGVQANTLEKVLEKLNKDNNLLLPDGRKMKIWQASG